MNCSAQNGTFDDELFNRVKALHDAEPIPQHPKLPSIEEAWTLPIPAELTQRQTARRAPKRNLKNSEEKGTETKWETNALYECSRQ